MIRSEAEDFIRDILGRSGTDLRTQIIASMNLAKRQLEGSPFLPWFLITEVSSATTVIGEERLTLPTNFLREVEEEGALFIYDTSGVTSTTENEWIELVKWDNETLRNEYSDLADSRARPTHYALVGNYFKLYPVPDANYTVKMLYYGKVTDFSAGTDTENVWLKWAPDLLIARAGLWVARRVRDKTAQAIFAEEFKAALQRVRVEDEARRQANFSQWMGMNDD
jgi:hypothetical protein